MDPDIEASGLRISCAMPAAISPTAASRCCKRALRSSRLRSVTSLECVEIPISTVGKGNHRHHQADVQEAAITRPVFGIDPQAAGLDKRGQLRPDAGRQLQDFTGVMADRLLRRNAGDRGRRAIEGQHPAFGVRRHQAAQKAVNNVLVERAQVPYFVRGIHEARIGRPKVFRQGTGQQRHSRKAEQVDGHRVLGELPRRQLRGAGREPFRDHVEILRRYEPEVQHHAQRPPPAVRRVESGPCSPR